MLFNCSSGFDGFRAMSFPASMARSAVLPNFDAPFIFKASVNINPSKFKESHKSSRVIIGDKEEGVLVASHTGIFRCPTIMPDSPLSIYALNGGISVLMSLSLL